MRDTVDTCTETTATVTVGSVVLPKSPWVAVMIGSVALLDTAEVVGGSDTRRKYPETHSITGSGFTAQKKEILEETGLKSPVVKPLAITGAHAFYARGHWHSEIKHASSIIIVRKVGILAKVRSTEDSAARGCSAVVEIVVAPMTSQAVSLDRSACCCARRSCKTCRGAVPRRRCADLYASSLFVAGNGDERRDEAYDVGGGEDA
ncbi:hypothetical protein C8R44DRAFT_726092 [Mycena epipterygia]|nr:hypothetical protein C8R44DRAFT_726092 [Mycena epipterygia]